MVLALVRERIIIKKFIPAILLILPSCLHFEASTLTTAQINNKQVVIRCKQVRNAFPLFPILVDDETCFKYDPETNAYTAIQGDNNFWGSSDGQNPNISSILPKPLKDGYEKKNKELSLGKKCYELCEGQISNTLWENHYICVCKDGGSSFAIDN